MFTAENIWTYLRYLDRYSESYNSNDDSASVEGSDWLTHVFPKLICHSEVLLSTITLTTQFSGLNFCLHLPRTITTPSIRQHWVDLDHSAILHLANAHIMLPSSPSYVYPPHCQVNGSTPITALSLRLRVQLKSRNRSRLDWRQPISGVYNQCVMPTNWPVLRVPFLSFFLTKR